MKNFFSLSAWVIIIFSLFSCDTTPPDVPVRPDLNKGDTVSHTLLLYAMAENSLSNYVLSDIDEIFKATHSIPNDCRLFAFVDDSNPSYTPYICQFYNNDGVPVKDTIFVFDNDFCSSDTVALAGVLDMLLTDYPTKTLDLVMWSHGDGWLRNNKKTVPARSIGVDNGKNSYSNVSTDVIDIEELAAVLENQPVKIERLMFDACFMQTVETVYALRNAAEWIIASPAEIPGDGAPYDRLVPLFFSLTAGVKDIIDEYKLAYDSSSTGVVLSAVKCGNMQLFADATYPYVKKYFNKDSIINVGNVFSYLNNGYYSSSVSYPAFFDMNAVMLRYLNDSEYAEWKKILDETVYYLNYSEKWYTAVLGRYIEVDPIICSGLSMYIPQDGGRNAEFNADFSTTEWYSAAGWNEAGW